MMSKRCETWRANFGACRKRRAFSNTIANIHFATRGIDDAIDDLPALDEGGANEEEGSKSA
jgi:hypothetical protein